jgi:hypothetical protein
MVDTGKLVVLIILAVIALALIIAGSAMLGSNKSCQTTDDTCVTAEKRRKGGVAMVVIGVVLAIGAILFGVYIISKDPTVNQGGYVKLQEEPTNAVRICVGVNSIRPELCEYNDESCINNSEVEVVAGKCVWMADNEVVVPDGDITDPSHLADLQISRSIALKNL